MGDAPILAAIDQCMALHESVVASFIRTTLARKWMGEKEFAKGINLLQEHLRDAEATGFPRVIVEVHSLLGELHYAQGNFQEAESHADAALAAAKNQSPSLSLVAAYRIRYQVAERRNDLAAALARYKAFAEAEKTYLGDIKSRELAYQIVREESQEKSQQISLLNRQNALLQLQQQVNQQAAANSRLYMLLFALLAATISYWAYKTKRMQMSVKHMAEIDSLTGICNRHHFTGQSEKTLQRCAATGEPVSLLMFDLDYFKSINDNYGHVTGDWVLKRVAVVCSELCRGIDHIGRIGGEEFAILLHGCDLKAATRVAEDCRVRLSRIDPLPSGYVFPISASFGVSSNSTSGYDLDKLLSHADQMLYRAKREGRNRVRAFVTETSAELTGIHFGKDSRQVVEPGDRPRQDSRRA
jgi:diguanylate cyclase (GGDEF)-like protein